MECSWTTQEGASLENLVQSALPVGVKRGGR